MDVLVLNRNFFAIQVTSWQRALRLVFSDRADIIDEDYRSYNFSGWCELSHMLTEHPSGFLYTPAVKIAMPEVIALKYYDRIPFNKVKFTRKNLYEHYNYRCCYCGKKFSTQDLNLDHVIPKSRGGKTDWMNVVTSCIKCNLKKGNKLLNESGMEMVIQPSKPLYNSGLSLIFRSPKQIKASWQKFVDSIYWNIELEQD